MTIAKNTLTPSSRHVRTISGNRPATVTSSGRPGPAARCLSACASRARRTRVGREDSPQVLDLAREDAPSDIEQLSHERIGDAVIHGPVGTTAFDDALLAQRPELL